MCARGPGTALHGAARPPAVRRRVLDWTRAALRASHADECREQEAALQRLEAEHKRLGQRIHAMSIDKLDGLVDTAFFETMSKQWRAEQDRCLRAISAPSNPA